MGLGSKAILSNEVHIWHASVARLIEVPSGIDIRSILSEAEQHYSLQLNLGKVRNEYLATRVFIRQLLSHYFPDTPPSAWDFAKNKYGKPSVNRRIGGEALEFNISHSHGVILCAITVGVPIGVDVELRGKMVRWGEMAGSLFSPQEVKELQATKASEVHRKFFEHWTLKEAFIKALGMGFSFPLQAFSFEISGSGAAIRFSEKIDQDSAQWQFRLFEAVEGYQCALAAKCDHRSEISLVHMGNESQLFLTAA